MTDRPILFSAPMVRALLDGRKTQTRRIVKPQPPDGWVRHCWFNAPVYGWTSEEAPTQNWHTANTRFAAGDRLWVKERGAMAVSGLAYQHFVGNEESMEGGPKKNFFWPRSPDGTPYKPRTSMFCPRWASRLTLIVESVRVERLNDISEADAIAEGIGRIGAEYGAGARPTCWDEGPNFYTIDLGVGLWSAPTAAEVFKYLWQHIHDEASWDANPFVAAISFRCVKGNIDSLESQS